MDSSANCNLCANCVKNCPNDAITLTAAPAHQGTVVHPQSQDRGVRARRRDHGHRVHPEHHHARDLAAGAGLGARHHRDHQLSGRSSPLAFVVALAVPAGLLVAASATAARRNGETTWRNFARFGYALIPLDVAGHVAHNLFHLLAEGKSVLYTALPLFGHASGNASAAIVSTGTIKILQYAILALGIAASAYTAHRIANASYSRSARVRAGLSPYLVLIAVFGAVNAVLFMLPMAMRM